MSEIKIIKTDLALVVKCECGQIVAATIICGGTPIEKEFTNTIAKVYQKNGTIELIKTSEFDVIIGSCKC